MPINGIDGNDNSLINISANNGSIVEKKGENFVTQTKQNFTNATNLEQKDLITAYNEIRESVVEKLLPCFKNSWKNFWHRGRKRALKDIKKALDSLGNENSLGEPDFGKAEQNKGLFKNALHNKSLSKETRKALASLIKKLKSEMEPLKSGYSLEQLKSIFKSIDKEDKNNLFGKAYKGNNDLVFKVMDKKEDFEDAVLGNRAFTEGAEKFEDNKEYFYRQSNGLVTKYIGSFEENGQYVTVFERVKGENLNQALKTQHIRFTKLKTNLKSYREAYDGYRVEKDDKNIQAAERLKIAVEEMENKIKKEKKTIDLQQCIILSQTAEGIAAVHESGCIHRDINLKNTMVGWKETEESARDENDNVIKNEKGEIQMRKLEIPYVKLIDQGLTVDMKSGKGLRSLKEEAGTPRFMAPETIFSRDTSPACDVFSFGITLLLTTCEDRWFFKNARLPVWQAKRTKDAQNIKDAQKNYFTNLPETINECYTTEEKTCTQPFLRDLVLKCCSLKPEDRPSAAQVAYCLQVYRAAVDVEQEKELNFDNVLKMAEADRPKGIPLALRDMMQSGDEAVRQRGCRAVLNLGDADPSYKKTPSYGLALLRSGKKDEFKSWALQWKADLQDIKNTHSGFENLKDERLKKQIVASRKRIEVLSKINTEIAKGGIEVNRTLIQEQLDAIDALNASEARLNQNPLFNLMQRITTDNLSNNGNAVWGTKDIKVSQDEFSIINNLFPKESINPKNIV